jgi:hypothetical protein
VQRLGPHGFGEGTLPVLTAAA